MATRNVVLTDAQSELVNRWISSGRYQNASEVLRAGLRLLEREEVELSELRARIETGLEQARAKDLAEGDGEHAIRRAFAVARARGRLKALTRLRQYLRICGDSDPLKTGPFLLSKTSQSDFARSRSTNF